MPSPSLQSWAVFTFPTVSSQSLLRWEASATASRSRPIPRQVLSHLALRFFCPFPVTST